LRHLLLSSLIAAACLPWDTAPAHLVRDNGAAWTTRHPTPAGGGHSGLTDSRQGRPDYVERLIGQSGAIAWITPLLFGEAHLLIGTHLKSMGWTKARSLVRKSFSPALNAFRIFPFVGMP
jgi:hypothetical protein